MIKTSRFWYNVKDSFHFYRELFFGPPWSERKWNKGKKKPCLFIRFLDCISDDFGESGCNIDKRMNEYDELQGRLDKFLGLPPEAKNGCRFL